MSTAEISTPNTSDYGSLHSLSATEGTPDKVEVSVDRVDEEIMVMFETPPSSRKRAAEKVEASSEEPSSSSVSSVSRPAPSCSTKLGIPKKQLTKKSVFSGSAKINLSKYVFKKASK